MSRPPPFSLRIPLPHNQFGNQSISALPVNTALELKARYERMLRLTSSTPHARSLETWRAHPASQHVCIRHTLQGFPCNNTDPHSAGYVPAGDRDGEVAKSKGTGQMEIGYWFPCAHYVKNSVCGEQGLGICLVPLPEGMREGKEWWDLGFWVDVGQNMQRPVASAGGTGTYSGGGYAGRRVSEQRNGGYRQQQMYGRGYTQQQANRHWAYGGGGGQLHPVNGSGIPQQQGSTQRPVQGYSLQNMKSPLARYGHNEQSGIDKQ